MSEHLANTTTIQMEVATFNKCLEWAEWAERTVLLEKSYPFSADPDLPFGGIASPNGGIVLKHWFTARESFLATYLHEVAHIVCINSGLDFSPESRAHSKYFACLVFLMYRRASIIDKLHIYDFSDTMFRENGKLPYMQKCHLDILENDGWPSDDQLIERFTYIIRRSKQLADAGLTIERAAGELRKDLQAEWCALGARPPARPLFGRLRRLLSSFS